MSYVHSFYPGNLISTSSLFVRISLILINIVGCNNLYLNANKITFMGIQKITSITVTKEDYVMFAVFYIFTTATKASHCHGRQNI